MFRDMVLPFGSGYLVPLNTLSGFPVLVEFLHLDSPLVGESLGGFDVELESTCLQEGRTLPGYFVMVSTSLSTHLDEPAKTGYLHAEIFN